MHTALRYPEDKLYTDIWKMTMVYDVRVYNWIPDMQSGLSSSEILSRSKLKKFSETFSNCHIWGFPTYVLQLKSKKPRVRIHYWIPRSQRGVNIGFRNMHLTQVGLVLNLLDGSTSPHYHVVFDEMFSTVVGSIGTYPEFLIRLVSSRNSKRRAMLDQKGDLDSDNEWLTDNEQLTCFSTAR